MSNPAKSQSRSSVQITWHGHSTWSIRTGKFHLLIDPFLESNPVAKTKPSQLHPTHILISHGHFDHIADAASIAKKAVLKFSPITRSLLGWPSTTGWRTT